MEVREERVLLASYRVQVEWQYALEWLRRAIFALAFESAGEHPFPPVGTGHSWVPEAGRGGCDSGGRRVDPLLPVACGVAWSVRIPFSG